MNGYGCLGLLVIMLHQGTASAGSDEQPTLRMAAQQFRIGVAVDNAQLAGQRPEAVQLALAQFNSLATENAFKWQEVHPQPDRYRFEPTDRLVALGEIHDLFLVGHTLIWHRQTPDWVFAGGQGNPVSRDQLVRRMRDHIHTVVGRYRGRIDGWDVVNEALNDDGTLRDTPWLRLLGEEYLALAFQFAHEADPDAELYYNDYSLVSPVKRDAAVRLVQSLRDRGLTVTAIGMQGHWALETPTRREISEAIVALSRTGPIMITELDIDLLPRPEVGDDRLDPYRQELPESIQQALADRYREIFAVLLEDSANIQRVTFWGIDDGQSWRNDSPIPGRTNHPLLFDRQLRPKPSYHAVLDILSSDPHQD